MATRKLDIHRFSEFFPPVEEKKLKELAVSIGKYGVENPVVLYQGLILDGRARYQVCKDLGIDPPTKHYEGPDPIGYMIRQNLLSGRKLNRSQRTMIAVDIDQYRPGNSNWAEGRKLLGTKEMPSRKQLQDMLDFGNIVFREGRAVALYGTPEEIAAVRQGTKAIHTIYEESVKAKVPPKVSPLKMTEEERKALNLSGNEKRSLTLSLKGDIWKNLKTGLSGITSMPDAEEVVKIARGIDRSGLVNRKLPMALKWLKEFEDAWYRYEENEAAE
jgi:hypothetical protein